MRRKEFRGNRQEMRRMLRRSNVAPGHTCSRAPTSPRSSCRRTPPPSLSWRGRPSRGGSEERGYSGGSQEVFRGYSGVMEEALLKIKGNTLRGFLRVTFLSLKRPQTHLQSTNSPCNNGWCHHWWRWLVGGRVRGQNWTLEMTTFGLSSAEKFSVLRSVQGRDISCNKQFHIPPQPASHLLGLPLVSAGSPLPPEVLPPAVSVRVLVIPKRPPGIVLLASRGVGGGL